MEQVNETEVTGELEGQRVSEEVNGPNGLVAATELDNTTPGDLLRALPAEAQKRGSQFVSAQAMQARLFSVYDAAAAAEDALALVQHHLTLTLNRGYYGADEIESMADQLDSLLALESLDLSEEDLVKGE
jgi:hypothetical protein